MAPNNSASASTSTVQLWIEAGYRLFAFGGESALKVEVVAREVGINKSSFYHHFADMDVFLELLMKHHVQQCISIEKKEKACKVIDPDLIHVFLEHKVDLLFQRQLLFHRDKKNYRETLQKASQHTGSAFVELWMKELQVAWTITQVEAFFELAIENFYLQLHPDNFNQQWLSAYFKKLFTVAQKFSKGLDGSV
jgi:AcrR family transcriptional regulator